MRTKKLLIGLLAGALLFHTTSVKTFAAEDKTTVIENETIQTEATLEKNVEQTEKQLKIESVKEKLTSEKSSKEESIKEKSVIEKKEVKTKSVKVVTEKKETKKKSSYSESDLKYLACVIYTESGNQSRTGKIAVGNVVLNRVKSSMYKNTIYGVIHEPNQFGVVRNGSFSKAISDYEKGRFNSSTEKASIEAAKAALNGEDVVGKRLSFTRYSSSLAKKHPSGVKIGDHYFY